jgi:hypothetical protein
MQKLIVTYKLLPGVSLYQHKVWSCAVEQRITATEPAVIRFEVYAVEGAHGGEPYCDIIENIELESYDAFAKVLEGEGMRYCMETFPRFVDVSTVKLVYAYLRGFACGHLALDTDNRARPDQSELDSLAEDCMQDHRYTGLFTSAPLNKLGGTGSRANALAHK